VYLNTAVKNDELQLTRSLSAVYWSHKSYVKAECAEDQKNMPERRWMDIVMRTYIRTCRT
jgi:hypothetical protein